MEELLTYEIDIYNLCKTIFYDQVRYFDLQL